MPDTTGSAASPGCIRTLDEPVIHLSGLQVRGTKVFVLEPLAQQGHATQTRLILEQVPVFRELAEIASAHHERPDGKRYPHGLKRDEIALETRIITVANILDALTADRPYRRAMQ